MRGLEEEHRSAQRHKQHNLLTDELQAGAREGQCEPSHARTCALKEADTPRRHLESALEVLVEIPNDEEPSRRALQAAHAQVPEHAPIHRKEVFGQGGDEGEENHVHHLREGHQDVWWHPTREGIPEEATDKSAHVECDPECVITGVSAGAGAQLDTLQHRLANRGENVAESDDDMYPKAQAPCEGLHEPPCHGIRLYASLLRLANVELQGLCIPLAPSLGHTLPHDVLHTGVAHRLVQKLRIIGDVQRLHVLSHHCSR
mmetsp:Transcript_73113/g.156642  ORF Transcript_73113/g.156642 Transcript_73113/m.156642 type:complete len:259 (+) Transcript_73113:1511-2287(+)